MRRIAMVSVLVLVFVSHAFGQNRDLYSKTAHRDISIKRDVTAFVMPFVNSKNFSGEVLVARSRRIVLNKGYGMADYENAIPITQHTKFYIASISKSFTAAAILLLQERGLLRVNDPVSRFVPDFPNGERITIHQLLSHTSGLANYTLFPEYFEIGKRAYTTEEAVAVFRDRPLDFQPGTRASYCNSDYVLLAYIIEKVSRQKYGEFLKVNFLDRLEMSDTGNHINWNQLVMHRAQGYNPVGIDEFERSRYLDYSISTGAGSLYSTTADLLEWAQGLLKGHVLKPSSLEQMFKVQVSDHLRAFGYGWTLNHKRLGRDVIAVDGWDDAGFTANLVYYPKDDLTVIVLSNLNIASVADEIATGVSAVALGETPEVLKIKRNRIEGDLARKIVGTYKLGDDFYVPGTTLNIVEKDGVLFEQQRNPDRLVGLLQTSDLEFIHRSSWGRVKFEMDGNGDVQEMLFYGRFKAMKIDGK